MKRDRDKVKQFYLSYISLYLKHIFVFVLASKIKIEYINTFFVKLRYDFIYYMNYQCNVSNKFISLLNKICSIIVMFYNMNKNYYCNKKHLM